MFFRLHESIDYANLILKRINHLLRVVEIHEITTETNSKLIAVRGYLYSITGEKDDGINNTGLPLVAFANLQVLLPIQRVGEQVNVVPLQLEQFLNQRSADLKKAKYHDWENGWYSGKLAFYSV